jgi:hypothetical protein
MFKRVAIIALAVSAIALVSCSSSGGDDKKTVNPLNANEQLAATALQEINNVVMGEISDAMGGASGPKSARAVVTDTVEDTVYDENLSGYVFFKGSVSYDVTTGKVTFDGTYSFTDYEFTGTDPEDEGTLVNYVVNGTETVNFSSTTKESDVANSSVTVVSEDDTGNLDVTIDGVPVKLVFDYNIGYTYTVVSQFSETGFLMTCTISGDVEGKFNGNYAYYPINEKWEIDSSDFE